MENELEDKLHIEQRGRPGCDVQHEMRAPQGRPQPQPRKSLPIGPTGTDHTQSTMTDNTVTPGACSQTNSLERNRDALADTDSEVNRMDFQCRTSEPVMSVDMRSAPMTDSPPPLPPKTHKPTATIQNDADESRDDGVSSLVRMKDEPTDRDSEENRMYYQNRFLYQTTRLEIDLLLIGKTGNGKSALGNSILGRNTFESKPALTSVTKSVSYEVSEYNGKVIKVVDGPGVCDTDMSVEDARNLMVESLSYAIALNPKGYHAFLLVVKFGERFTRESRLTIDVLKKVFGESFVRKYCILVMTHGDQFEEETSFRDWLSEQRGDLMDLVRECGDRIILYDNKTKEKEKREGLLNTLLDMVQILALENCRYTNEQFEEARQSREALMIESKRLQIEDEAMKESSLILGKLQLFQADTRNCNQPQNHYILQQLSYRTITLLENLKEQDKNTGTLKDMISHVQSLQNSINEEIKLVKRISQMMKKDDKIYRQVLCEKVLLQKAMFHQILTEGKSSESAKIQNRDPELNVPSEHATQIQVMNEQWEKTRQLEAQQKEMRRNKNSNIFSAIQKRICTALKIKIKEKSTNSN